MVQTIAIPKKPVSWNVLARKNYWLHRKVFAEWELETTAAIRTGSIVKVKKYPVILEVCAYWKQKRKHDIDSLLIKPIVDTLVRKGILLDDSLEYVAGVYIMGKTGEPYDGLTIKIWELE